MSTTDKRIVKMQFDNAQFEAGVSKSMSTLDKLKAKLNFSDSAKDISKLQTSIDNVDFSKMQSSLQFLEKRFSATGEFIYKIWDGITDKAINAFKRVESATLGQIKNGGWARALNIANAQFQTAGLGASWEAIRAAADYAVTDTAYGLDEAAKTASQLLASGIDYQEVIEETEEGGLTQMHKALRAISGVAAMTNSSYSEIAQIFTRIAGSGRVFAIDLNSIAARGLNAAAVLAKALGTTEAEIRELVRQGEIDFNTFAMAMDEAYGEHAKKANDTFQGAMSNMRAALSRVGAIFAQPMIDKTNRFFNALTGRIKEVQKALSDVKLANDEISPRFATHFAEAWDSAVTAAVNFVNAIDLDWIKDVANTMDNIAIKMKSFFDWVNEGFSQQSEDLEIAADDAKESLKDMLATQEEYQAAMHIMFKDKTLVGNKRVRWLEEQGLNPQRVQKYIDSVVAAGWNVDKASIKIQDSIGETKDSVESLGSEIDRLPITFEEFNKLGQAGQDEFLKKHPALIRAYRETDEWMAEIAGKERDAYDTAKAFDAVNKEYAKIMGLPENQTIYDFAKMDPNMRKAIYREYPQLEETFYRIRNESYKFEGVATIFQNISESFRNISTNIKTIVRAGKNAFRNVFNVDTILPGLIEFTDKFYELTDALLITEGGEAKLQGGFEILFTIIRGGIGLVGRLAMKLMDIVIWIANVIKGTNEANQNAEKSTSIIASLWKIISKTAGSIKDLILNFGDFISMVKNTEGVQRLGKAMSDLGKRFRKDVRPASDSLAEFADSYDGLSIDGLAKAIGWIADKIAWLVEQIPKLLDVAQKAFGVISSFVKDIWSKVTGWFGGKDAGSIFDKIKNRIVGTWQYTEDIGTNIKKFFSMVWNAIKSALSGLDFNTLKDVGKAAALIFAIYEILELIHNMSQLLGATAGMIKSFSGFFDGLKNMFSNFGRGFELFGTAAVIQSIAWLFVGIAAFLAVVSSIKEDALYRGTAIVTLVALFILLIVKAIKKVQATRIEGKNVNNIKIQLFNGIVSFALLIASVALAMKWVIAAINDLSAQMNELGAGSVVASSIIVGLLLSGIIIGTTLIAKAVNKMEKDGASVLHGKVSKTLTATALMIAALGVSVKLMVGAIGTLADIIKKAGVENTFMAFGIASTMLILMAVSMKLVMKGITDIISATGNSTGKMVAAVVLMAVFGVTIAAIIAELAYIAALARFIFNWDGVLQTLALVGGTLLAIGGMVVLIGAGAKLMKGKDDSLTDVALIMAIAVAGIAIIIHQMVKLMKVISGMSSTTALGSMGIVVATIAVFVGGVALILGILSKAMNKENSKVTSGDILIIAASLVVIASAFVVFAKAMETMANLNISTKAVVVTSIFAGLLVAISAISKKNGIADRILKIGIGFTAFGAGFMLFGAGLKLVGKGLSALAKGVKAIDAVVTFKLIAFMAAFAAIIIPIAKVLGPIVEGLGRIIGSLGSMIAQGGSVIFAGLKTWVGAIPELLRSLAKDIGNLIGTIIKTISGKIKDGVSKVSEWYNNLPTEGKKKIVKVLGVLFAVMESIAPDVVKSTLRIIFRILDTIAEQSEYIANRLIHFLVKVLISFAQAITKNAHVIGNAAKSVAYAILAIVLEILALVFDFIQSIPVLGDMIGGIFGDPAASFREAQKEISSNISEINDDTKSWIKSFENANKQYQDSLGGSQGALMNVVSSSSLFKKVLGDGEMAFNSYASAAEKANEAVEFGFGKSYSPSVKAYAESSKVVRKSYDEYQALTKKAEEETQKQIDLNKRYAAQFETVEYLKKKYGYEGDEYSILWEQGADEEEKKNLDRAQATLENLGVELADQKQKADAAKTAAEEYASSNQELIGSLIELQNAERELDELRRMRVSGDNREALKNASDEFFKSTGFDFDFNSISQAQLDAMMRSSPEFRRIYSEQLQNAIKDRTENQKALEKSLVEDYRDTQKKIGGTIGGAIAETIEGLKTEMNESYIPAMELNGVQLTTGLITGISSKHDDVQNATKSVLNNGIVNTTKAYLGISNGSSTVSEPQGENFIQGFIDGSNAKLPDLTTAVENIMQSGVIDTTNSTLDEHSPSRVMAASGKNAILGLIQGLTDNADYLNQTSTQIGDAMIVSFGAPFERIAQMASGKIPYNPSITPVLDPTSIANGASSISSMFQGQTVQLDGYTGRLAADISGVSNQNDAIVEQLMELRSDMNDMTETILGMQIVLDSGTVVGELSDGFDYSLGTASIRKKRGN